MARDNAVLAGEESSSTSVGHVASLVLTVAVVGIIAGSSVEPAITSESLTVALCRQPLVAKWHWMHFYPFSIFYVLLAPQAAALWFSVAHVVVAGCGLKILARRWGAKALTGALPIFFAFQNGTPAIVAAVVWIPLVLALAERACGNGGRDLVFCAAALALQFLSGARDVIVLTWVCVALMAIKTAALEGQLAHVLKRLGVAAVLGLAFVATQVVPLADIVLPSTFEQKAEPPQVDRPSTVRPSGELREIAKI